MQEDLHARLEDTITKEKGLTSTAAIGVSLPLFHQKLGRALNVICQLLHRSELQNVHFDVSSRCMYVTCSIFYLLAADRKFSRELHIDWKNDISSLIRSRLADHNCNARQNQSKSFPKDSVELAQRYDRTQTGETRGSIAVNRTATICRKESAEPNYNAKSDLRFETGR